MGKYLNEPDLYIIIAGVIMGTLARFFTLRVDYRQIPTYPSAYFNNIVMGFIASALGAIAIPAVLTGDFVSITFLTVAVQEFREIRASERDSLGKLEHTEYTRRGEAYIDGISKTFESRNYISLVTALLSVLVMKLITLANDSLFVYLPFGVLTGFIVFTGIYNFTKGKTIGDICSVRPGQIEVKGSELYVDGIFVANTLGTDHSRQLFREEGLAVVVEPKKQISRITIENYGQRQAILFEAVKALGVRRYQFTRRNFDNGNVIVAFVPIINDPELLLDAVSHTPILENSRKVKRIIKT